MGITLKFKYINIFLHRSILIKFTEDFLEVEGSSIGFSKYSVRLSYRNRAISSSIIFVDPELEIFAIYFFLM